MLTHLQPATNPRETIGLSLVTDELATENAYLDAVKTRRLASLEAVRGSLVQTMLDALSACQRTNNQSAQLLLSAAVRDLDDMDRMLHELRHDIANRSLGRGNSPQFISRITPSEPFPDNLRGLNDRALHVLNSKVHRQIDVEYLEGGLQFETQIRNEELNEELTRREADTGRNHGTLPSS